MKLKADIQNKINYKTYASQILHILKIERITPFCN